MNFNRPLYKQNAKAALKGNWGKAVLSMFLVSLIASAISGMSVDTKALEAQIEQNVLQGLNSGSYSTNALPDNELALPDGISDENTNENAAPSINNTIAPSGTTPVTASAPINTKTSPIVTLVSIFFLNVLSVGVCSYFIKFRKRDINIGNLFDGFKANYLTNVVTMFVMGLKIVLWSLLLVIPGIVKSYQYSMVPYILADDASVTRKEAFARSKQLTKGHKWTLFVMDLSFIGWALLCIPTCGIGFLWLEPYMEATKAEAYEALKAGTFGTFVNGNAPIITDNTASETIAAQ